MVEYTRIAGRQSLISDDVFGREFRESRLVQEAVWNNERVIALTLEEGSQLFKRLWRER